MERGANRHGSKPNLGKVSGMKFGNEWTIGRLETGVLLAIYPSSSISCNLTMHLLFVSMTLTYKTNFTLYCISRKASTNPVVAQRSSRFIPIESATTLQTMRTLTSRGLMSSTPWEVEGKTTSIRRLFLHTRNSSGVAGRDAGGIS